MLPQYRRSLVPPEPSMRFAPQNSVANLAGRWIVDAHEGVFINRSEELLFVRFYNIGQEPVDWLPLIRQGGVISHKKNCTR